MQHVNEYSLLPNSKVVLKIFPWFLVGSKILHHDQHVLDDALKEINPAITRLPDVLASHLSNMSL